MRKSLWCGLLISAGIGGLQTGCGGGDAAPKPSAPQATVTPAPAPTPAQAPGNAGAGGNAGNANSGAPPAGNPQGERNAQDGGMPRISLGGDPDSPAPPPAGGGGAGVGMGMGVPKGGGVGMGMGVPKGGNMGAIGGIAGGGNPPAGGNPKPEDQPKAEPEPPPRELTFRERAEDYFSKGQEADAILLMQAHALANPDSASEMMSKLQWSIPSRLPKFTNRIAVGIDLTNPNKLTSYSPISKSLRNNRTRGGGAGGAAGGDAGAADGLIGFGGGAMPGGAGAPGGRENKSGNDFADMTGDMGSLLVDHVRELYSEGNMGTLFASLSDKAGDSRSESGGGGNGMGAGDAIAGGGGGAGLGMMPGKGGGLAPGGGAPPNQGPPAGGGDAILGGGGMGAGGAGSGMIGMGGDEPGPGGGGGNKFGGAAGNAPPVKREPTGKRATANKNRLAPGITFIGVSDTPELTQKALAGGYDLLVVFEVEVEQRRQRTQNNTRAKLFVPGDKKTRATTALLNNTEVAKKLETDEDYIEKSMKTFFNRLDDVVTMRQLPTEIDAEGIAKRVENLLADKSKKPLEVMFEAKFWHSKQLLTDSQLQETYTKLLSADEAIKLISGSEEERIAVLKRYAP